MCLWFYVDHTPHEEKKVENFWHLSVVKRDIWADACGHNSYWQLTMQNSNKFHSDMTLNSPQRNSPEISSNYYRFLCLHADSDKLPLITIEFSSCSRNYKKALNFKGIFRHAGAKNRVYSGTSSLTCKHELVFNWIQSTNRLESELEAPCDESREWFMAFELKCDQFRVSLSPISSSNSIDRIFFLFC